MVGIGEGDFKGIRAFIQETHLTRDMVQFVSFNSFLSGGEDPSGDLGMAGARLAKKALARIPEQITSFKMIAE